MRVTLHSPEQIIRELRIAEQLLNQGQAVLVKIMLRELGVHGH